MRLPQWIEDYWPLFAVAAFALALLWGGFTLDRRTCANLLGRARTFQDTVAVVKSISSCEVWVVRP